MPTGGQKEITWNAENDRKLFLSILKIHDIKVNHEEVAKAMSTEGAKPTANSISHRLTKLKAMAKKEVGESDCHGEGTNSSTKKARKTVAVKTEDNGEVNKAGVALFAAELGTDYEDELW